MINNQQVKKAANSHILGLIAILAPIYLLILFLGEKVFGDNQPVVIQAASLATVVALVECIVVAKLWSWMARCHKDSFATFYMVCPACRIFAVLIALIIAIVCVGKERMIPFIVVFVVMYFLLLVYHSVFFSNMSRKLFNDTQNTNKE